MLAFSDPPPPGLRDIRETLIARSFGEVEEHTIGIGARVFGTNGEVTNAVVSSGPSFRLTSTVLPTMEPFDLQAAHRVPEQLGGNGVAPFAQRCLTYERRLASEAQSLAMHTRMNARIRVPPLLARLIA
ncbi:MAG: hypothetical protein ACREQB_04550 [Candidatus Binataceae bacterium]